jgi:hypothetical protein
MKAINGVTVKKLIESRKSLVKKVEEIVNTNSSFAAKYIALKKLDEKEKIYRSAKAEKVYQIYLRTNSEELLKIANLENVFRNDKNRRCLKKHYINNGSQLSEIKLYIEDNNLKVTETESDTPVIISNYNPKHITREGVVADILNSKFEVLKQNVKTKHETRRKSEEYLNNMIENALFSKTVKEIFEGKGLYTVIEEYSLFQIKKILNKSKIIRREKLINSLIINKVDGFKNSYGYYSGYFDIDGKEKLKKLKEIHKVMKEYDLSYSTIKNLESLTSLKINKEGVAFFLDTIVKVTYKENVDWNYYSKNYGKPKVTISDREVIFYSKKEEGNTKRVVPVDDFKGDFILKAYAEAFKIEPYKEKGFARKVQLNDYLRVKKIKSINDVEIWKRTLNEKEYDFVAVQNKTTFHAHTRKEAVEGLKRKIEAKLEEEEEIINKELGFKLGFCKIGMENFCEDNNIDFEGKYTRKELRNIVLQQRNLNCEKYFKELKKIKILLNCK